MRVNWNRMLPLIVLAVAGVALLVVGAITDSTELLMAGTGMTSAAIAAAAPTNAIGPRTAEPSKEE